MEIKTTSRKVLLGLQMMIVAYPALIVAAAMAGLDATVALFAAGVGTLLFHGITGGKVPIFLATSFSYAAAVAAATGLYGLPATLGGLMAAGVVYILLGLLIRIGGVQTIQRYFPPVVAGPVIIVIGLGLAPAGVGMASANWIVAVITLAATIVVSFFARGLVRALSIVAGIAVGYVAGLALGVVDFTPLIEAPWFALPRFTWPVFDWRAILFVVPVAIAPALEHIGDILSISSIARKNFFTEPGVDRTLLGNGVATFVSALFGGPGLTTYSEVSGAYAFIGDFDPAFMWIAAVAAIVLSFVAKLGALLTTIPTSAMGGIVLLLFGLISAIGLRTLVVNEVDFSKARNLFIAAVVLILGVGGAVWKVGTFELAGVGLAGCVGVLLNLVLPQEV